MPVTCTGGGVALIHRFSQRLRATTTPPIAGAPTRVIAPGFEETRSRRRWCRRRGRASSRAPGAGGVNRPFERRRGRYPPLPRRCFCMTVRRPWERLGGELLSVTHFVALPCGAYNYYRSGRSGRAASHRLSQSGREHKSKRQKPSLMQHARRENRRCRAFGVTLATFTIFAPYTLHANTRAFALCSLPLCE